MLIVVLLIFSNVVNVDVDGGVDVDVDGGGVVVVGSGDDCQYDHDHANKRGIVIHSITPFAVQTNTNAHLYRLVL